MKATVDSSKLIANLGAVFSGSAKVLSELLQNARRAGATRVEVVVNETDDGIVDLIVADDGCGVEDFASLVTVAGSGWNDETAAQEKPYGMGFFASFFVADTVTLESNGKILSIDSKDLLAGKDIGEPLPNMQAPAKGTIITLSNVRDLGGAKVIKSRINDLARYSSLPITLNGEALSRDLSLEAQSSAEGAEIVQTDMGVLVIEADRHNHFPTFSQAHIVLQDLRVRGVEGCTCRAMIFYCDSTKVQARMPDRDKLLDEQAVVDCASAALAEHYRAKLEALLSDIGPEAFTIQYFHAACQWHPALVNGLDMVPGQCFARTDQPNLCYAHASSCETIDFDVVTRQQIESGEVVAYRKNASDVDEAGVLGAFYLVERKAWEFNESLPEGHWLRPLLRDFDPEGLAIDVAGDVQRVQFVLDYCWFDALLVDRFTLTDTVTGESVEVSNDGVFIHSDEIEGRGLPISEAIVDFAASHDIQAVMARGMCIYDDFLEQMGGYIDEHDNVDETQLNNDVESLRKQFVAAKGGDAESVLRDLIGSLPPSVAQALEGKALSVTVTEGVLEVKAA
jgi:hypothetical protein